MFERKHELAGIRDLPMWSLEIILIDSYATIKASIANFQVATSLQDLNQKTNMRGKHSKQLSTGGNKTEQDERVFLFVHKEKKVIGQWYKSIRAVLKAWISMPILSFDTNEFIYKACPILHKIV